MNTFCTKCFMAGILWLIALNAFAKEAFFQVDVHAMAAERLVLVTFPDRSINRRLVIGGPGRGYRPRGPYPGSTWAKNLSEEVARDHDLKVATQWPITELGEHCAVLVVPAQKPLEEVLDDLAKDERVASVQPMNLFQTQNIHPDDPYFPLQKNLQTMNIVAAHSLATGREISIAVIDTGVDLTHNDLSRRISTYRDFVKTSQSSFNEEIHGTAIAGIIAAQANHQGILGVAPDVILWPMRACWTEKAGDLAASCSTLSLAIALNTAIKMRPHIINMSLTGPDDPLLRRLIQKGIDEGIVVVAAKPVHKAPNAGFPANMRDVIAVCEAELSVPKAGQEKPCLAAPGKHILTTFPKGTYNFIDGSSASTAHISGLVALLLELDPSLTPQGVRKILWQAYRQNKLPVVDAGFAMKLIRHPN